MYPTDETTLTRTAEWTGSSAAALIPTGNPSAAPIPQTAAPRSATGTQPPSTTSSTPATTRPPLTCSARTRPHRSRMLVPQIRPSVIAATKIAKPTAPNAFDTANPSTRPTASQSLATPSLRAEASSSTPITSVRGSRQARRRLGRRSAVRSRCAGSPAAASGSPGGAAGRKLRIASTVTTAEASATAPRCMATGSRIASASAPSSAPATVPRLKPACRRGMSDRPSNRSTAAPSTFMATSQVPMP